MAAVIIGNSTAAEPAAISISKYPATKDELGYQRSEKFASGIEIGGPAPDGSCLTLAGETTSLHAAINADRLTILNFGAY